MSRRDSRLVKGAVALGALASWCLFAAGSASAETLALTGGTLHTVSGPVIENGTLVIENGKIAALGRDARVPEGARVVSCAGKHVYPGMISANTILGLVEVGSVRGTVDFREAGETNPNIRAEVAINPESDLLPVTRVNGVTTAMVAPRGGTIAGTAAVIHLDGWTYEDMTLQAPVGLFVQWPSLTRRGFGDRRSEQEMRKAWNESVENLRSAFKDARAYWKAREAEATKGVPRHDRDLKYDAMGRAVRGEIPVLFQASSLTQIRAALRFAEEEKLPRVILVGADDAWRVAHELKARDIAVIAGPMLAMPERRYEPYDQSFTLPEKLREAGVRYCVSDGGGGMDATNARNLPYHAAMAAAFGLPRDEALKSVTLYPAQILGVADRVGSLEVGKVADVFVSDGDPLEIETQVEQVYIAGKPVSMETRHTRLFSKYDHKPRGEKARKK
jgi:imidazolonepropionase-like amidohydrolase